MDVIVKSSDIKINKLTYETFSPEGFDDGEVIKDRQTVKISAKLAESSIDETEFMFLFDVLIVSKNEDEEIDLREFHLDIFYVFSFENVNLFKELTEEERNFVTLFIYNHFQKEIEKIIKFNTSIGQESCLSIKENIVKTEKRLAEVESTLSIAITN